MACASEISSTLGYTRSVAPNLRPDQLASLLRRAVRERILLPGQTLNQDELASRFGVSRIPLREALRTLAGEGLIVMRPGIGAVVAELRPDELEELLELRMALEPPLLASVVGKVSAEQLAELRAHAQRLSELALEGDVDSWCSEHYAFHRRLLELAGRRHSLRLVMQVVNLMEPYARVDASLATDGVRGRCDHQALLDAIEAGDRELTRERAAAMIEASRTRLTGLILDQPADEDPLATMLLDLKR